MRTVSHILVAVAAFSISGVVAQNYDVSSSAPGYAIKGKVHKTRSGLEIPLELNDGDGVDLYGKTIRDLVVNVDFETADRLHVKIGDKDEKQIPVPDHAYGLERPKTRKPAKKLNYDFKYTENPFGFQVIRKVDKEVIFDTSDYPLVFEDQYLELSTAVPNDANLYGIGEVTAPFRRNNEQNVTTVFARDAGTPFYENIYGAHPYYNEIRKGKAHGVFLLNAHGMDVFFSEGRVTYKVIGGVLEFYFFVPKDGKPNSVLEKYTDLVGKPFMPAMWMLGWHHCRYGFKNISHVNWAVDGYAKANIPLETIWVDIDYMDHMKDFTFDEINFPEESMVALSEKMHANNQRMITMVDPALSNNDSYLPYEHGKEMDVFMKNSDGSEYIGQVWPGFTVFPDWWHPNVTEYWDYWIIDWMKKLDLDGLWIDMNEPASFCLGSCGDGKANTDPPLQWELPEEDQIRIHAEEEAALKARGVSIPGDDRNLLYPNYAINSGGGNLSERTAPMTSLHHGGISHYDYHNLYGHAECSLTRNSLLKYKPDERPFILTRSSFSGSGQYVGHWTGDNHSSWAKLKNSIAEIFNFQMFGIAYSGADVCGFFDNATETLCTRWMEIGAFYPFARNHNTLVASHQEPFLWERTAEASRRALAVRYALLPYYYTLFEEAHRVGTGVWRPLIFAHPEVDAFLDNDVQTLVGTDILLTPVVEENATSVEGQFPEGIWYDWYTYESHVSTSPEEKVTLEAEMEHIPVHIRGGAILPLKTPAYLVKDTYASPYTLLVALDQDGEAEGRLYIDDQHSVQQPATSDITFSYKRGVLRAKGKFDYADAEKVGTIKIVGADDLTTASYNGKKFDLESKDGAIVLEGADIELTCGFTVKFR
ncbi:alpha glucosidase [Zychaea mexicana]|uniref:alpha glucosidase n=1 Tax=Zychaea mexicana TaxID=64656 RepID=UPI0022FE9632|nr:alpha glucosidase [Zychaea mexicana]KAI9495167.1 alpha glucosidase [Zychaea mexicana]